MAKLVAWLVVAAVGLIVLAGCQEPNYRTLARYDRGLVVILDGAGDITRAPNQIERGLDDGGVKAALEVFPWSAGHNVLADQLDLDRNRAVAHRLSTRLVSYMVSYPNRPVHLIGISAGSGIVVFAAEQMPEDKPIDGICLLASSLTANYDLTKAMSRVRNRIYNFSSVADLILSLGVTITGTVDRGSGPSAGLGGFNVPRDPATAALYKKKLVEMPWNISYLIYGNDGGHLGPSSPGFVKKFMAPVVLAAEGPERERYPTTQRAAPPKVPTPIGRP